VKVLVVDDHVIVREGIHRLLARYPDISVKDANTPALAQRLYRTHKPDVVLLDLNLPNASGLELLRRLLTEDKNAQVLVFSVHFEPLYASRAMNAGARGYISKSAEAEELVAAIRHVAEGGRYIEREIASQIALMPSAGADPMQSLSTREADILRMLAEGKTLAAIAGARGVTYKTIANTCAGLKAKLGVAHTGDLIRLAIEMRERR
jgi:two-component system, NarL family, invasion response regulator UvrY